MNKPVIRLGGRTMVAMVHVLALPGAPDYDPRAVEEASLLISQNFGSAKDRRLYCGYARLR